METVLVLELLIFAAVVYLIVCIIRYLIRYGIDYYFEKLAQSQKNKED